MNRVPWKASELRTLEELIRKGYSYQDISTRLNRSIASIKNVRARLRNASN